METVKEFKKSLTNSGYIQIVHPKHPLASPTGVVLEHRAVLYDYIGPGAHNCYHCGTLVIWGGMKLVVDHLDFNKTNNRIENLVPSCCSCNTKRSKRKNKALFT